MTRRRYQPLRTLVVLLLLCAVAALGVRSASAQPTTPGASGPATSGSAAPAPPGPTADSGTADDDGKRQEAKRRFLRGVELGQQERWDAALAEFLASRDLHPTRVALKNAAMCLEQLSRHAEALEMYQELLELIGDSPAADEKKAADDAIARLRKSTAEIVITADQPGASIVIDSRNRGTTPLPHGVVVDAGTRSVRVFKEGFVPFETQILVAGGQRKELRATLSALARSGRLHVAEGGERSLEVVVDGAVVGKTPWEGTLSVGTHMVFLKGADDLGTPPSAAVVENNRTTTLTLAATTLDAAIRIEPTPSNAEVFVDGVPVGHGLWEGKLKSGPHKIEVAASGFLAYRHDVVVLAGQRQVQRVALERDLTSPMWRESVFQPHVYLEAVAGGAFAPSFAGAADKACSAGDCSSRSRPLGFLGGARGGYQLTSGLGLEVFLGYLQMSEKQTRSQTASGDYAATSSDYHDATKLAGPLAALSASYQFFQKTPLLVRVWAGAMRGKATFENGGTFAGTAVKGSDPTVSTSFELPLAVGEASQSLWIPFAGPEARFGYRFSRRFAVDLGVAAFLFFPPEAIRKGQSATDEKNQTRSKAGADIPGGYPDGSTVRLGVFKLPREAGFGTFFAIVPTIAGRFDL